MKKKDRKTEFLGELGQDRCGDTFSIHGDRDTALKVSLDNVCVKTTSLRIEGDKLFGSVTPHPPLGEHILDQWPDAEFALRALVNTREISDEVHRDIVDIVSFDLVSNSTLTTGEEE
jgi:hypothetical protein